VVLALQVRHLLGVLLFGGQLGGSGGLGDVGLDGCAAGLLLRLVLELTVVLAISLLRDVGQHAALRRRGHVVVGSGAGVVDVAQIRRNLKRTEDWLSDPSCVNMQEVWDPKIFLSCEKTAREEGDRGNTGWGRTVKKGQRATTTAACL
jgi:hypothetical protein